MHDLLTNAPIGSELTLKGKTCKVAPVNGLSITPCTHCIFERERKYAQSFIPDDEYLEKLRQIARATGNSYSKHIRKQCPYFFDCTSPNRPDHKSVVFEPVARSVAIAKANARKAAKGRAARAAKKAAI